MRNIPLWHAAGRARAPGVGSNYAARHVELRGKLSVRAAENDSYLGGRFQLGSGMVTVDRQLLEVPGSNLSRTRARPQVGGTQTARWPLVSGSLSPGRAESEACGAWAWTKRYGEARAGGTQAREARTRKRGTGRPVLAKQSRAGRV